ncbi:hypothetical protein AMTR_s00024p00216920, partial [Amborella trichopoda]
PGEICLRKCILVPSIGTTNVGVKAINIATKGLLLGAKATNADVRVESQKPAVIHSSNELLVGRRALSLAKNIMIASALEASTPKSGAAMPLVAVPQNHWPEPLA